MTLVIFTCLHFRRTLNMHNPGPEVSRECLHSQCEWKSLHWGYALVWNLTFMFTPPIVFSLQLPWQKWWQCFVKGKRKKRPGYILAHHKFYFSISGYDYHVAAWQSKLMEVKGYVRETKLWTICLAGVEQ